MPVMYTTHEDIWIRDKDPMNKKKEKRIGRKRKEVRPMALKRERGGVVVKRRIMRGIHRIK